MDINRILGQSDLRNKKNYLEKAVSLNIAYGIKKKKISDALNISRDKVNRGVASFQAGREIGKSGRPKALTDLEEEELRSYIIENSNKNIFFNIKEIVEKVIFFIENILI